MLALTRARKAAVAAIAVLTAVAVFDESNVVSLVVRKAISLIAKFLSLTS